LTKETLHLEQIFRKYRPGLVSFAMTLVHNIDDAEEIVHDVFLAYWNGGQYRDIQEGPALKSYLFTSVKNRSLNHLRRSKLVHNDLPEQDLYIDKSPGVTEQIVAKEAQERIALLIDRLPEKCRQIFIMSRTYELSHKEIAEILDITPKTVENQISIALKFMRHYFPRTSS
jgi:RNA polymerase sigma-70 factor (ECF subfamily)